MFFKQIYEEKLAQYAYLIGCQQSGEAVIIDPMRDIDRYEEAAEKEGLEIVAAADTHIHADYLSGLREFAEKGVTIYASDEGGEDWKYEWLIDSEYSYRLLKDGGQFSIGNITFKAEHTPGHTPEHISYLVTDEAGADAPMGLLTGDFVFVGDVGRPDLLESAAGMKGGMVSSAKQLYKSVQEFKNLPEYLQVWPGHGAGSACGKALGAVPESTVGYELRSNRSIRAAGDEEFFVDFILEDQPEPPLYFTRMKRDNRQGPPILGELPHPPKLQAETVVNYLENNNMVLLDTRNRTSFMKAHAKNSLFVPFDKHFNTVAGSYVREDETICLVIDVANIEKAVRDLVRIGLDNIEGYVSPEEYEAYIQNNDHESIEIVTFDRLPGLLEQNNAGVLDVRGVAEYRGGHVDGAVNISHTRLPAHIDELSKNKEWFIYCRSGRRSAVASALLHRDGFHVKYIDDKIENRPEIV